MLWIAVLVHGFANNSRPLRHLEPKNTRQKRAEWTIFYLTENIGAIKSACLSLATYIREKQRFFAASALMNKYEIS